MEQLFLLLFNLKSPKATSILRRGPGKDVSRGLRLVNLEVEIGCKLANKKEKPEIHLFKGPQDDKLLKRSNKKHLYQRF